MLLPTLLLASTLTYNLDDDINVYDDDDENADDDDDVDDDGDEGDDSDHGYVGDDDVDRGDDDAAAADRLEFHLAALVDAAARSVDVCQPDGRLRDQPGEAAQHEAQTALGEVAHLVRGRVAGREEDLHRKTPSDRIRR